jgi:hypothetical protein
MQLPDARGKRLCLTAEERAAFLAATVRAARPVRTFRGVPLNMRSKWMGYATLEVMAIYADALEAEERGVATRMWS